MSTAIRFEPLLPRRPLADVLVSLDADTSPCLDPVALPGGSRRHLLAAAALAQARLTGEPSVCLYEQHAGRWREREIELDPAQRVERWIDALARAPSRALSARTEAELALAWNARPRRPSQALAQLSVVGGQLMLDVDPLRIDRMAAGALRDAVVQAWHALQVADERIGALSILSTEQRANLLCRWQNLRHDPALDDDLLGRIERVAERCGSAAAIVEAGRKASYAELWQRSGAIAHALCARGIERGGVVALHGPRGIERIIATLAIWRAGATCLPLDDRLTPAQLPAQLQDCSAALLITLGAQPGPLPVAAVAIAELAGDTPRSTLPDPADHLLLLDVDADHVDRKAPIGPVRSRRVVAGARGVLRMALAVDDGHRPVRSVLHIASPASARAVFECFAPLLAGGVCVIHDEAEPTTHGLARALRRQPVELALLPTGLFERIAATQPVVLARLSQLLVGPLPPSPDAVRRVRQAVPALSITRVYGHAECTPLALCQSADDADDRPASLGRPLAETTAHVLAPDGGLLPVGAAGEICIGGCAVALGYRAPDGGTERRGNAFVADPLGADGARLFRTGDRGRRLPDGRIEYIATRRDALRARTDRQATVVESRLAATLACAARTTAVVTAPTTRRARQTTAPRAIAELCTRYRRRTARSLARAGHEYVEAPTRLDYPLVIAHAEGARIVDIDGNEYFDAYNGGGANLFGWQAPFLRDAWQQQLERGEVTGVDHPLADTVTRELARLTHGRQAALCSSGADALALAFRIARQATGRTRIVRVQSGTAAAARRHADRPDANAAVDIAAADGRDSLEWLDHAREPLAAVVLDPFGQADPQRHSRRFVAAMLARAQAAGALAILDERSIGFRCAPGGARQYLAVEADLSVFGEMLGGGLPLGAVVATRAIEGFDGSETRRDCHPLAVAGAAAMLQALQRIGPELQHELNARTAEFIRDANRICRRLHAPIELAGFSSCWTLRLLDPDPRLRQLYPLLRLHGIHLREDRPACLTWSHRVPELRAMLDAFGSAMAELEQLGVLRRARSPQVAAPIVLRPLPAPPRNPGLATDSPQVLR